jgi:hypothetical protein
MLAGITEKMLGNGSACILVVAALCIGAGGELRAQTPPCVDNGAHHDRQTFKNRTAPDPILDVPPIKVADALTWPVIVVTSFNDSDAVGIEELQVIHLRGFVRVFKCEDDGDYHLEIADSGKANARRVIVEAPPSQPGVRAQLEQLLGGVPPSIGRKFDGTKAVPLDFMGWRFFDVSHQIAVIDPHTHKHHTMAQIKKGQGHGSAHVGTLWEPGHAIFQVQPWTP